MKHNFKYGKLDNKKLVYAPNILVEGKVQIINASADKYAQYGWLPIERTEQPEAEKGFYFEPAYAEQNGRVVQEWERHEIPVTDQATKADT